MKWLAERIARRGFFGSMFGAVGALFGIRSHPREQSSPSQFDREQALRYLKPLADGDVFTYVLEEKHEDGSLQFASVLRWEGQLYGIRRKFPASYEQVDQNERELLDVVHRCLVRKTRKFQAIKDTAIAGKISRSGMIYLRPMG